MRTDAVMWIMLVGGTLVAGISVVGFLVSPRRMEPLAALGVLVGIAGAAYALLDLARSLPDPAAPLYGLAFAMAALGGGYALAATLLLEMDRGPHAVGPVAASDIDAGPAVIVLTCAEPPRYSPIETASLLSGLVAEGFLDTSTGALPLLFFAQKARYNAIGGESPSIRQLAAVTEALERTLYGVATRVDWAVCSGPRVLAEQVADAARTGHKTIVVCEDAVASSLRMSAAKRDVDAMRLDALGVSVRFTGPLGSTERLTAAVTNAIMAHMGDPADWGVVLVGHGQPRERSRQDPLVDELETTFLNRVSLMLVERGIAQSAIRIAWAEWSETDVTSTVRHLAALGRTHILVAPAVFPLDTLGTRLDLEVAVRHARVDDSVATVILPAWRDDPALIAELRSKILAALEP